ncbi:hypothetical protein BBP00_00005901 [Phytophthora kernoviae]|uniref:sphingomyelin phosphodiesterase n=1 Tax=Phytophthora kernoviae TaxID=325452 RepID=A0A3F2RML9_9STRA|nr:hypothetical protein BBP00_00005901 [Phytophthora kernoviae]
MERSILLIADVMLDGLPDGVGVLLSVFGSRYAGAMKEGKKHGAGVELRTNGTSFSGEFENGVPCGLGIYVGTLGDKYIGQWEDGSRHGIGVCVDPDAEMATARFNMDEPVLTDNSDKDATASNLSWEEDIQPHILRAIIAEKAAIRYQEDARQRHTDAAVQEMTAIGPEKLNTPESIEVFEAKKELELEEFLQDQSIKLQEVNAAAGELKVAEAQLIQRQNEIFCRPEGIHSGQWFKTGDYKDLRVALLLRKMARFDVVILQEMFEAGPRQKRFVRDAYAMGFRYHCGSVWPRLLDSRLIDGGLLILSRFPIVERDQLAFSQGSGSDGICAKGVLYARIQLSPDLSDSLHVFTTHTQAGDNRKEYSIRLAQLQEMHRFIARTIRDDPGVPVLITGDFNLDARHDLIHDTHSGLAISTRCRESKVYQQLIADFERVVREARLNVARDTGKKMDVEAPLIIDLMKHCDITKLGDEVHPITNGDGHSSLVHKVDPLSPEKDGKCIDYMFFFPGVSDQASAGTATTASTTTSSTSGDGEGDDDRSSMESLAPAHFHLTLVEKGTTVDHCNIAELTEDSESEEYNDEDENTHLHRRSQRLRQQLPITHLSDHYGLRAQFLLETTSLARPDSSPVGKNESLASVLQLYFPQNAFAQQPQRLWKWKLAFALLAIVAAAGGVTFTLIRIVLGAIP